MDRTRQSKSSRRHNREHVQPRKWAEAFGGLKEDGYAPFKMGMQSYTLRGFPDLEVALSKTEQLGLKYWESFPMHIPMTADPVKIKAMLGALKVKPDVLIRIEIETVARDPAPRNAPS